MYSKPDVGLGLIKTKVIYIVVIKSKAIDLPFCYSIKLSASMAAPQGDSKKLAKIVKENLHKISWVYL